MRVVGRTCDGRDVVSGAFDLYATHGVPLDVTLSAIQERQCVPSWVDFYRNAIRGGWKPARVIRVVEDAARDVLGGDVGAEIGRRLRAYAVHDAEVSDV